MASDQKIVYQACDNAIRAMNRENLEDFGRLKATRWDEIQIIRRVVALYARNAKKARKRYFEVAFEAYILALLMCGIEAKKAHKMAEKEISLDWVDDMLERVDPVAGYMFERETERKAYRLAETLEVSNDRDFEINKALRFWSQQLGQFAINATDYAMIEAYKDAGIKEVYWVTQKDERVCEDCEDLDGQTFPVDEIPPKPHLGCRCLILPVIE